MMHSIICFIDLFVFIEVKIPRGKNSISEIDDAR